MVTSRAWVVGSAAAVAGAAWGCAAVMGLEDRPLVLDASVKDAGDAATTDACVLGTRWCETSCPRPDFCDDFDDPEPAPSTRWSEGAFLSGGSLTIEADPSHDALGAVLFARAGAQLVEGGTPSNEVGAAATLLQSLSAPGARGLRIKFRARFADLSFDDVRYDGDLPGPSAAIVGVLDRSGNALGATAWRDPKRGLIVGVVLRKSDGSKNTSRPVVEFEVTPATMGVIRDSYSTFDIVFGSPAVLASQGLACPEVDPSAQFAVHTTVLFSECKPLPELTEAPAWLTAPSITTGTVLVGTGNVAVAIDGLAVYYLR